MGYYSLTYKRNLLKKKSMYSLSMSIKGSKPLKEKTNVEKINNYNGKRLKKNIIIIYL